MNSPIFLPYGRDKIPLQLPEGHKVQVLEPREDSRPADTSEILRNALDHPIGSPSLEELTQTAKKILIITNDHTRPMPSMITIPALISRFSRPKSDYDITILIATGLHRPMTQAEMREQLGEEVCQSYKIVNHAATDEANLTSFGVMSTGNELFLNSLVAQSDLIIAEGFIEPHFFAGFSGGRKSILPGVAGAATILANHKPDHIGHQSARQATLAGNPIHDECMEAARLAGLKFILNVALDEHKRITAAFAGDPTEAHLAGCRFVEERMSVDAQPADIVITSNNGYPLDRNLYQVVKGIDTAAGVAKEGGVIIVAARCIDGVGHENFQNLILSCGSLEALCKGMALPPSEIDKWQVQVLARAFAGRRKIILVSEGIPQALAENMFFTYAPSIDVAVDIALSLAGPDASICVIPEGPVVIPHIRTTPSFV